MSRNVGPGQIVGKALKHPCRDRPGPDGPACGVRGV